MSDFLGAGGDTSTTVILWAVLYFMHNPDVSDKMRYEMQRVVGEELPSLHHQGKLPYCRAVIAEVMRIRPVVPLWVPHSNKEDLHINDYLIPKGSTLIANVSSIFEDPKIFEEPDVFKPTRFLDGNGDFVPSEYTNMVFGSGND